MTDIHSQRLTLSLLFFAHISCGYRLTRALTRIIIMIMEKGEKIMKMMKKQKNNSRLNCKLARLNLNYFLRSCNPLSIKWCQSVTSSMWHKRDKMNTRIFVLYFISYKRGVLTFLLFYILYSCLSIKERPSVTSWASTCVFYISHIKLVACHVFYYFTFNYLIFSSSSFIYAMYLASVLKDAQAWHHEHTPWHRD